MHRDVIGFLAGRNHETAAVIDVKTARLRFGRVIADHAQRAAVCGNAEDGQNAGGAIAGVQEAAVRRDVDVRRPAGAVEVSRHDVQRLRDGVFAAVFRDGQHVHRAVQLIDAVGELVVVVERHMTRAGAGGGRHRFLRVRRQLARQAQVEQTDAVFFQARHQHQLVGRIDVRRVRRGQAVDLLNRRRHHAVVADRADAGAVAAVGGGEQVTPLQIGGDMGRAARQRRHAGLLQRAVRLDAVADDAERRTHADVQVGLVRMKGHRLHLARHVNGLQQRQRAGVVQLPNVDLLALRAGDINDLLHVFSLQRVKEEPVSGRSIAPSLPHIRRMATPLSTGSSRGFLRWLSGVPSET